MPGFVSIAEKGKLHRNVSPEELRKRRKSHGAALYKNNPSVPDSLVQFAEEIHNEDRISRIEEIELGEKTQEAIRLQNLYDVLRRDFQREPTDEEWCAAAGKINMEAICQTIEEGIEAKNKLVTANLRMVQSVVNTYLRNGLSTQYNAGDLMQEGILALIRAAEKFEPERGWKFSTYAMYWVRASVKRSQIYQSRVINVPQRLHENYKRLQRLKRAMAVETGRKPTTKELGEAVGMTEKQVKRCFTAVEQRCFSLDQELSNSLKPGNESNGETLVDIIAGKFEDSDHLQLQRVLLREDLIETLQRHLTPEEVDILLLRYGLKEAPTANRKNLNGGQQVTIAELSRIFGLKPDKVRRTIDNSLKQLEGAGLEEWLAFERDLQ
jgi:RNA polymerase primary sigma factor